MQTVVEPLEGTVGQRKGWRARGSRLSGDSRPMILGVSLTLPFFALMAALVVYPIVKLVLLVLAKPGIEANVRSFFNLGINLTALRITFVDSLLVTGVTVACGTIVAWSLVTTTRRWVRLALLSAIVGPLVMNTILKAYAFSVLLEGPGLVNRALIDLHLIHTPLNMLYNQFAAIVGMVYWLFPYAVLPLYVTFLSIDQDLLTAAESLGASRTRALRDVCLPLALGGVVATVIIDYVLCLGFFLMPLLLGGVSVPFTSNLVWEDVTDFYNLTGAAVSSLILLLAAVVAIGAGYLAVGRERLMRAVG